MSPALGNVVSKYGKTWSGTPGEIERRARSRAELFMLEDHKTSAKEYIPGAGFDGNYSPQSEALGYGRGFRDAMIEVMSWVTGRDTDEILAELHDSVVWGPATKQVIQNLRDALEAS